ncbi:MAG: hypothetical protein ACK457_02780 [Flavobacteriia bacterium]|jgi:hypothetical protein
MKYLFFVLPIITLLSCTDLNKGKQISAIDGMNRTIDSIQTVLLENQIDTIPALQVATNTVELRIKNYYYADTIDMALGRKMDAYKVMRRSLGPLGRSFITIKNGVTAEHTALENLKKDIENGDGDRQKYDEYVEFEKDKVDQLRKLLTEYIKEKDKTMKSFNDLHQELYDFSMEWYLKNKDRKIPGK